MPAAFRERVLAVVERLAPGEVVSYGDVAAQAGYPGAARGVGAVLAGTERPVPWWRVVYADGRLAPGKEADQGRRLQAEGVGVRAGRVGAPGAPGRARTAPEAPAPYAGPVPRRPGSPVAPSETQAPGLPRSGEWQ